MASASVPLSVLDLAPIGAGSTAADALRGSVRLAREAEQLGYDRYWFAEHHDVASVASCSPSVLVAAVAAVTERIRVGSGGVMLPNHQPLVVAEQFGTLEALHPQRIDLGVGRAPAADQAVAAALRCTDAAEFPGQLGELVRFFGAPQQNQGAGTPVSAIPAVGHRPELWLLGVGPRSAQLAGMLGLSFAYAHHIAPENVGSTLAAYRSAFRPSGLSSVPHTMIAVGAVCAESDAQAQRLAAPAALLYVRLRTGDRHRPLPSISEAAEYSYTDQERALVAKQTAGRFVGTPEAVRAGIDRVVAESGADEVMVTTQVAGFEDRRRSYALLAEAYALDRAAVAV
ncbi:LLM class flavin-dependent oxidoreductase [Actinoalloteichus hymeniacidonis]|uniref:Luciferase family oxidoreductase, group 1 n=1 Tax=Actinoalloteichus hymeniacidonis TaxID=340345 RepID=A0AAC9HN95_9PSEU|nr:LLM class flavin-dependent oxidoreductase [Actinoalloteichus hymeniacidonis]AOS62362.1 luciferase family oxidoreductase, group 1 [Actinoalloteichus hymeniacidonis]MBB5909610.1 luciferase family oxidoreductase group 1 [Actinoalloteichus hymeniacidonis]